MHDTLTVRYREMNVDSHLGGLLSHFSLRTSLTAMRIKKVVARRDGAARIVWISKDPALVVNDPRLKTNK